MADHMTHRVRIRTRASQYQCETCPSERVYAWACVQGAGIEEIVIGVARGALWETYNDAMLLDDR